MSKYSNLRSSRTSSPAGGLAIGIGWICALLSVVIYPFIFGVIGVIMGIITSKNGSRKGLPLIVTSIVCMSIGLLYGKIIFSFIQRTFGF